MAASHLQEFVTSMIECEDLRGLQEAGLLQEMKTIQNSFLLRPVWILEIEFHSKK
jgi:hypothetical protein